MAMVVFLLPLLVAVSIAGPLHQAGASYVQGLAFAQILQYFLLTWRIEHALVSFGVSGPLRPFVPWHDGQHAFAAFRGLEHFRKPCSIESRSGTAGCSQGHEPLDLRVFSHTSPW